MKWNTNADALVIYAAYESQRRRPRTEIDLDQFLRPISIHYIEILGSIESHAAPFVLDGALGVVRQREQRDCCTCVQIHRDQNTLRGDPIHQTVDVIVGKPADFRCLSSGSLQGSRPDCRRGEYASHERRPEVDGHQGVGVAGWACSANIVLRHNVKNRVRSCAGWQSGGQEQRHRCRDCEIEPEVSVPRNFAAGLFYGCCDLTRHTLFSLINLAGSSPANGPHLSADGHLAGILRPGQIVSGIACRTAASNAPARCSAWTGTSSSALRNRAEWRGWSGP